MGIVRALEKALPHRAGVLSGRPTDFVCMLIDIITIGLRHLVELIRYDPRTLARLAAIGAIVSAAAIGFALAGGWFDPKRLSPATIVDALEAHDGLHSGFRRAHAKGICVSGHFD